MEKRISRNGFLKENSTMNRVEGISLLLYRSNHSQSKNQVMKGNKIIVVLALRTIFMTIFTGCQQKIERTKTEVSFLGTNKTGKSYCRQNTTPYVFMRNDNIFRRFYRRLK